MVLPTMSAAIMSQQVKIQGAKMLPLFLDWMFLWDLGVRVSSWG